MGESTTAILSDNNFVGNSAFVDPLGEFCDSSSGVGLFLTGWSPVFPNVTRCSFVNNSFIDYGLPRTAGSPIRGTGMALQMVPFLDGVGRVPLYPWGVSNCFFGYNTATTADSAWGALVMIAPDNEAFIENSIFVGNRIQNFEGVEVGGAGIAAYIGSNSGANRGFSSFKVSNSKFDSNIGDIGALFLRNSHTTITNTSFIGNSAYSFAGGLLVVSFPLVNTSAVQWTTFIGQNTTFRQNRAGETTDKCCYSSFLAQGNMSLIVESSTKFIDNVFYPDVGLSTDWGCIANASCAVVPVNGPGEFADVSGVLLADGAALDLSQLGTTMRAFKVWDRALTRRRSIVQTGIYNISSTEATILNFVALISPGPFTAGHFNLHGQTEIIGVDTTKVFAGMKINNYGIVKNYESTIVLLDTKIFNAPGASWDFENFAPQATWAGSALSQVPATFTNQGRLSLPTGVFNNVTLDLSAPSSQLRYIVSNFWSPSTLSLDSLAQLKLGGSFLMDGNPLRDYSEPAVRCFQPSFATLTLQQPFQRFAAISSAAALQMTGDFSDRLSIGGYHFVLEPVSVGAGKNLTLTVVGFYPITVQINNEATLIKVLFPRPTNIPGGLLGTDCSVFLDPTFLATMSSPECLWRSATELNIRANLFLINATLAFKDAVVADAADPTFYVWGNATHLVKAPQPAPVPRIVLVVPGEVSSCSEIQFDASATFGTGAFPLTFSWTLDYINGAAPSAAGSAGTTLATLLAAQSQPVFTVPSSALQNTWNSLNVSLRVSSGALGTSATASVQVLRSSTLLLQVRLEGSSNRVVPTAIDSQVHATFSAPTCQPFSAGNVVKSAWTVLSSSQSASALSARLMGLNTTTIYIPARILAPDSTHRFQYTATLFASASSSVPLSSASVLVTVNAVGSPMSLVSTGRSGLVSDSQNLQVSVRLDDPDEISFVANPEPPQYAWIVISCPARGQKNTKTSSDAEIAFALQQSSAGSFANSDGNTTRTLMSIRGRQSGSVCSYPNGTLYALPLPTESTGSNASSFSIPPRSLAPGEYTLVAVAARGSRSSTTVLSLSVETSGANYLQVRIEADLRGADKHLSHNRLLLRGFIEGQNSIPSPTNFVRWSIVGQSLDPSLVATSIDNINLAMLPNALLSGRGYTFQLEVIQSQIVIGSSTLTTVVNSSPRGGNFSVAPGTGGSQGSFYTVSLPGWIDDDPPLRYVVSATDPVSGKEIVLTDSVELPQLSAVVPVAGLPASNYLVQLTAKISDTFESVTISRTVRKTLQFFCGRIVLTASLERPSDAKPSIFARKYYSSSVKRRFNRGTPIRAVCGRVSFFYHVDTGAHSAHTNRCCCEM